MNKTLGRILILGIGTLNLVVSGYFLMSSWDVAGTLPEIVVERQIASTEHGGAIAEKAGDRPVSWVTLEEMFVNVLSDQQDVHTLAFKLEVELFDEGSRRQVEERQAIVKNAIIEVAREQQYDSLKSLAGKLYFKEALVAQVNQTVRFPLVRDVHLASFSLR